MIHVSAKNTLYSKKRILDEKYEDKNSILKKVCTHVFLVGKNLRVIFRFIPRNTRGNNSLNFVIISVYRNDRAITYSNIHNRDDRLCQLLTIYIKQ